MTPRIRIERATKAYPGPDGMPRLALAEVEFEVEEGEFICLLGPSGCGKTTLLNLVAGFERPTSGRVLVDGRPVTGPDPGRICMFQSYALFPWRTVRQNVEFGLEIRGEPRARRRERAGELLRLVGLEPFAGHLPHQLSGGMQQRAALARALAVDPGCLLMDEPLGALDAITRYRMQEEISRIARASRKTVLFVTHDVDEAALLADRVVVMAPGPGHVQAVLPVPLPRPRSRTAPAFLEARAAIFRELDHLELAAAG